MPTPRARLRPRLHARAGRSRHAIAVRRFDDGLLPDPVAGQVVPLTCPAGPAGPEQQLGFDPAPRSGPWAP